MNFMNYLQNLDSIYICLVLLSMFIIRHLIVQRKNDLKLTLQFRLIFYGVLMFIFLFSLPSTPSLASFGYPDNNEDIQNSKKLLHLLQDYNKALVKTTEVLHWMIFITVFWFVSVVSTIIKHFKLQKSLK